ncbi:hypothetical protein GQ42DRAFT_163225 [Ramicandelaber brevisporus]|nr:hypothetical protein GQ42DRAFT_163225 [Ramicandelaber brevisporus]
MELSFSWPHPVLVVLCLTAESLVLAATFVPLRTNNRLYVISWVESLFGSRKTLEILCGMAVTVHLMELFAAALVLATLRNCIPNGNRIVTNRVLWRHSVSSLFFATFALVPLIREAIKNAYIAGYKSEYRGGLLEGEEETQIDDV